MLLLENLRSYHDVTCLRDSKFDTNWCNYFTHINNYFEMVKGDADYVDDDRYTFERMNTMEMATNANVPTINAFNKLHAR